MDGHLDKKLEDTMELDGVSKEVNQVLDAADEEEKNLEMQLHMLEAIYIQSFGYDIMSPEANDLFPRGWSDPGNYFEKIDALSEAMEENKRIGETRAYQALIEGVKKY